MRRYLGAFLSIVIVAVIGVSAILLLGAAAKPLPNLNGADRGTSDTPQGTLKHVSLTLQTFPMDPYEDPDWIASNVTGKSDNGIAFPSEIGDNPDWVKYWPTTNLVVPAHALVTVTIENYDSATPLLNPYYAVPRGITGQLTVDGQAMAEEDPGAVSHTFTIHGIPSADQPYLFVSVPVLGVNSCDPTIPPDQQQGCIPVDDAGMPAHPAVTTFSFITGAPGHYIWQCFDPCGSGFNGFGGPMSTKGYMSGTLTVE